MNYAYLRVSTKSQKLSRQADNVKAYYGNEFYKTYAESYTGTKIDRPEWQKLYKALKSGDTLVCDSVSRMSRNADEGVKAYFDLYERGVNLVFLNEPTINTEVYNASVQNAVPMTGTDADLILTGVNAFLKKLAENQIRIAFAQAQKEVEDIQSRVKKGIESAQKRAEAQGTEYKTSTEGKTFTTKKSLEAKEQILKYSKDFNGTLTDTEVIKLAGISRNSYYKYKLELRQAER